MLKIADQLRQVKRKPSLDVLLHSGHDAPLHVPDEPVVRGRQDGPVVVKAAFGLGPIRQDTSGDLLRSAPPMYIAASTQYDQVVGVMVILLSGRTSRKGP